MLVFELNWFYSTEDVCGLYRFNFFVWGGGGGRIWMWESEFVSPVYTLSCVCLSTPIFTLFRQQSPLKSDFKF